jgi:hypothetical protein
VLLLILAAACGSTAKDPKKGGDGAGAHGGADGNALDEEPTEPAPEDVEVPPAP